MKIKPRSRIAAAICFLFPAIEILVERDLRRWYELEAGTGGNRDQLADLHASFQHAQRWRHSPMVLRCFVERLREEHQRLETLENKSRSVVASGSLLVGLTSVLLAAPDLGRTGHVNTIAAIGTGLAVLYLGVSVLLGLWAGRVGVRFYIDPRDVDHAHSQLNLAEAAGDVIVAAIALQFTDAMSDYTERKRAAVQLGMRSLQIGLVIALGVSAVRVLQTLM